MTIDQTALKGDLLAVLDETFEHHHGIYLDRGTSLFATLREVDGERASIPVGGRCGSRAAQVAHVTFYLEVVERDLDGVETDTVDWGEIWRRVERVDPAAWDALRDDLERTYRRIRAKLEAAEEWEAEPHLEVALPIAVHTAYHLGEIRQALCTLAAP